MKRIFSIIFLVLYCSLANIWADNKENISIENVKILPGGEKTVAINLNNRSWSSYVAFQMDISLPEGLSIDKSKTTLTDRAESGGTLTIGKRSVLSLGDCAYYRLVYSSLSLTPIKGESGALVNLCLKASDDYQGGKVKVSNIIFSGTQLSSVTHSPTIEMDDVTFEVNKGTLVTVTGDVVKMKYGDAVPELTYQLSDTIKGTPVLTCEATSASPVGSYPIKVCPGTVDAGGVECVDGTLIIEKASLAISAGDYIKRQGDGVPVFRPTYVGFKNHESEDVLIKQPVFSTTATETSAPGTYPVTVGDAEAQNYDIGYQQGALTVTSSDAIIISARSYTRKYGDDNPALEFDVQGMELDGAPEIKCEAVKNSPVGTYAIVVGRGSVTNENIVCVNGVLTVEKAPLKIFAGNYTKKCFGYNNNNWEMPAFKASYTGFKNNETEACLAKCPELSTTAGIFSDAGVYPVFVSGAEADNYDISYEQGTLTMTDDKTVIITAKNVTRKYGDDTPAFVYDVQGAQPDGVPEITCEAVRNSPVGTYAIVVKKGTVKGGNVVLTNGTLTIEKAPLTISAGNYTKRQGEAMPTFMPAYGGFKNNENEMALARRPSVATTAPVNSAPGSFLVTVGGAESQNYDISYRQGTLTVVPPDAVFITVRNYTRTYGDENPAFEYDVQGGQLDGVPEISCEAVNGSPVGTYAIVVKRGTVKNQNIVCVKGVLTVEKPPLKIFAGNYRKKSGTDMPVFKAAYAGFKNGDTDSVLTKQPVFSTIANKYTTEGEYPVYVSGAEARNYEFEYVPGAIVVSNSKLKQKIVWNQEIAAKVGSTIEMEATATSGLPVRYSYYCPGGFPKPVINGNKITFPQQGNCLIVAIQDGDDNYDMASDTIQVNVLDDDEGLMYIDGIYYKYTDISKSALKVVKGYKPYMGKMRIPATVNGLPVACVDGFSLYGSYFLTDLVIGDNVTDCGAQFVGVCPNLRTVTLPNNSDVRFDERYPFNCDSNIKEIHCRSQIPYKADEATFNGSVDYNTCILYVPTGTKQAYREAEEWSKFVNIVEEDLTSVTITGDTIKMKYGDDVPELTYLLSDNNVTGTPVLTCEATSTSPVGSYPIKVSQGSVGADIVECVDGTLIIEKAPLTISAGSYTKKQGDAMPTFKAAYAGFKNGETEAVLTKQPVFSTTATEASAPGSYPVTVSGAEAQNYDISYRQGTLTVTQADAVVITARSYTRQYGDNNPTFEYDVQGATLDGVPEITCEAVKNSPVGTYAIVVKQGTVKNYNVVLTNGTLTIEKAPLTISAGSYTKKQGDAMPTFKAAYVGFKNGETEAVLTRQPVFSTTANENSEIGEYPVYVSGAEAQNYELTYVQGVLVVEAKKHQSIAWSQEIKAKVGSTIEMEATATSGMPVRYSTFKPVVGSAFHKPEIDGNKIKFPEEGNYMIIAIQDGNDEYEMAADTIQVNVLSDDDGLMCIDGIYYKYNDASKTTLKVVRGYKPYSGMVKIPTTANRLPVVSVDGRSLYASNFLTEVVVGDNVIDCGEQFVGACPNLKVVTLPNNNIAKFDDNRYPFNCDSGIKEIHCRSQIPYKADEATFNGFVDYTTCILYVPTGTKQAYQKAQEWCKFVNIVEEDVPSGIGNVQVVGDSLSWYTLQGIRLPAKPAAAGIYIHGGKKVIVK